MDLKDHQDLDPKNPDNPKNPSSDKKSAKICVLLICGNLRETKQKIVGIFSFFKKKQFFSHEEKQRIVHAIEAAEKDTSGEIRVFVESRNAMVDPLERAAQVFAKLKMQHTKQRNAVLLYIAVKDRELALFGDEGIHEKTFEGYWQNAVRNMLDHFKEDNIVDGIVHCVTEIGHTLKDKFPYDEGTDKNELSNDIVFGR